MTDVVVVEADNLTNVVAYEERTSVTTIVDGDVHIITTDDFTTVSITEEKTQVLTLLEQGPEGPKGLKGDTGDVGPAGAGLITVNFSYGDASPVPITTLLSGKRVISVKLFVDVEFNGTGAALSVGTLADHQDLMASSVVDPSTPVGYAVSPQKAYVSDTDIYLFITPGSGASTGAGSVVLQGQ